MQYFWLIPLLPLLGAFLNGVFGVAYFNKKVAHAIACGTVFISFVLAVVAFAGLLGLPEEGRQVEHVLYSWLPGTAAHTSDGYMASFKVDLSFYLDQLSGIMILVVTGIGFLIHLYSVGYMHHEEGYVRYFTYLNLFTFSMLTLVLAASFPVMFIGWEGVGLCSYLLIGYWYEKKSASDAGKKAFVVNRIGDAGFLTGMMFIFGTFGTLHIPTVMRIASDPNYAGMAIPATMICLFLFVGATGKSAQVPLYVWLPDAMEGPTPVSALIHAATMVTAGVYMVARCAALYTLSPFAMDVVAWTGVITALVAASIGLVQNDIKRVLAYSTVSQLGYMFVGCGVGAFSAGIFHLYTHAFFKALLFLGSGSVIHALSGEQDMRKMGGLKKHLPITFWTFFAGTLAIAGVPFLSGFFSKDMILAKAFEHNRAIWAIAILVACMTSFYMFRLLFMTFFGESRVDEHVAHHVHESPWTMTVPLSILAVGAVLAGYVGLPPPMAHAVHMAPEKIADFLSPAIYAGATPAHHEASATLEWLLMGLSVAAMLVGLHIARTFYLKRPELPVRLAARISRAYRLVLNKYYVDELYDALFVNRTKDIGTGLARFDNAVIDDFFVNGTSRNTVRTSNASIAFDQGIIDWLVNAVGWILQWWSRLNRRVQSGMMPDYASAMVLGILILVSLSLFLGD